jgi:hypothetical protein
MYKPEDDEEVVQAETETDASDTEMPIEPPEDTEDQPVIEEEE